MDEILESIAKFIQRIRPKTYNLLARIIVGAGVLLVAESQFGIIKVLLLALVEYMFGPSEILRNYINTNSNPWLGACLIVIGLLYHYLMTIGKEQIELKLEKLPKRPELTLTVLNSDMEPFAEETISLRGHIAKVPIDEDIPEYTVTYSHPNMAQINSFLNSFSDSIHNKKYYKERAELLKVWGGSELLSLCIENKSTVLATGVKVEVSLPKIKGVSARNTNEEKPPMPTAKVENRLGSIASLISPRTGYYDIKSSHNSGEYYFCWTVDDLQANTTLNANTFIFLRSEVDIDLTITVYCDQFERPLIKTIKVLKKNPTLNVDNSDLTNTDQAFLKLVDKCVMDGYVTRLYKKKREEYEHRSAEITPD